MSIAKAQTHQDVLDADSLFYSQNFGKGVLRSTAAVLVKYLNPIMSGKKNNLRGTKSKGTAMKPAKAQQKGAMVSRADVPAAYGFTVQSSKPRVTRTNTGAHIVGSDYAGSVYSYNSLSYEPAASVPLNPSYFSGAMLGSLSRAYEKYRFKRAVIEYIPSVPTSTQGQLIMLSDRSIKNPFLDGNQSSFLGRALSQNNAIACPLWQRTTFNCECSSDWSLVDPLIDGDLDDTIGLEVQLYTFGSATLTTGILMLHYEIEFKDPLYTFHSTVLPISAGIGTLFLGADDTAVNAIADSIRLSITTPNLSGYGRGSIIRLVFCQAASTRPTGPATWGAVASVATSYGAATNIVTVGSDTLTLATGTVFYGLQAQGNNLVLYNSYDSAVAENLSGLVNYQTATTAAGSWQFIGQVVRLGNALMMNAQ